MKLSSKTSRLARRMGAPTAFLTVSLWFALAAPAGAGLLVKSAPSCAEQSVSKPFSPWSDRSDYALAPGGAFEAGDGGWTLHGARTEAGNEPFKVRSGTDARSLELEPGDVATSPVMCVGLEHPTMRFFARGDRKLLSTLTVEVVFETSLGIQASAPVGLLLPNGAWQPTPTFLVVANLLPLLPNRHTPVQFRLRAIGGTWNVDDVYLDPKRRA
jgi:hypothetical protein